MNKDFKKCLDGKKLVDIEVSREMIQKEVDAAEFDLKRASNSFSEQDFKWCMVQAYYSMFHAAKGIITTLNSRPLDL